MVRRWRIFGDFLHPVFSATAENRRRKKIELECGPMPNVMAALPYIGGAFCKRSVIPFVVRRRKVWLTPAAGVPCSNAANIGERKTWTQSELCTWQNFDRSKSPRKSIYSVPAQKTAKDRAKFGWPLVNDVAAVTKARRETRWSLLGCPKLPNRSQPLVGRSSPYCENNVEDILLFNKFFPIVDTCLSGEDTARRSCGMVRRWRFFASFLRPVFPASRVPHTSDLHSKFALRPHYV